MIGPLKKLPNGSHNHEGVQPSGLPAGAGGQQYEPVRFCRDCTLSMAQTSHIGEHQGVSFMQRPNDLRGRAYAGDDKLGLVAE